MGDSFSNKTSLSKEELKDKIKGIIYGTAIGDGIGLATEFMHGEQSKILYGNGPIKFGTATDGHPFWRDAVRKGWFDNDFTDDSDQMLLIVQSMLDDNGTINPLNFAFRLREWCRIGFPELDNKLPNGIGFTVGSSTSHKDFLSNPLRASYEIWDKNERNLAANGALMRTGAVGASYFWKEEKVVENAMMAAKVTHTDPRSVTSTVIVSVLLSRLLRGTVAQNDDGEDDSSNSENNDLKESKRSYQDAFTRMIQIGSDEDSSYLKKFKQCHAIRPKKLNEPLHRTLLREIRRVAARLYGEPFNPLFEADFNIPVHDPVDIQRFHSPAKLRENVKPIDEDMMKLCKKIVNKYSFLVEANSLCPTEGNVWKNELYSHSFPNSLSALKLNERPKIGYTYKCLGAGLYLGTRKIPENMTTSEFFENLITQLLLEAGDADTNCAVAGAILGCRLGKSGLPKQWVDGIRHRDFLESISDKFCETVFKSMND